MKFARCPVCKSHMDLQAVVEDEAARELMAVLAKMPARLAGPLLAYLGLFSPAKQDLRNSRALKLAEETLALCKDHYLLGAAMEQTVQQIQARRRDGSFDPLKNHRYLKKVMTGIAERIGHQKPAATPAIPAAVNTPNAPKQDESAAFKRQMAALGVQVDENGRLIKQEADDE